MSSENKIVYLQDVKNDRKSRNKKSIYRKSLIVALCLAIVTFVGVGLYELDGNVPSVIYTREGEDVKFSLDVPAKADVMGVSSQGKSNIPSNAITIDLSDEVLMNTGGMDTYSYRVKLFGIIPFKQMDIKVVGDKKLIPVGVPVGIYMKTEGILVIGVGEYKNEDGIICSPSKYILKSGDYILEVNGESVGKKTEFISKVTESNGEEMLLTVDRGGNIIKLVLKPVKDENGIYKLGLWVRDNAQGVGTMTYVDEDGNFGALGHGITDLDTSALMGIVDGTLYETDIISLKKSEVGTPGEMTGMITYSDNYILGDIVENSSRGIFGKCNDKAMGTLGAGQPISIGFKQEIEKGPAQIISTVDGNTEYYDIEITDVHMDHDNVNRGIELKVTDKDLLDITGGIVQGMSGSPIIQNGKIIGAVTHVFVQDPTKGYGIFIEEMLKQ